MKTTSDFLSDPVSIRSAATLLVVLALSGCGGGGGGGPGTPDSGMPTPFTYPTSLSTATTTDNVEGFMSPYALNSTGTVLQSVTPTVAGATPSQGTIAITIDAITVQSTSVESAFVVTFDPAGGSLLGTPLNSVTNCSGCLKTETAAATYVAGGSAGTVTFTYLDPASMSFPLTYSALGLWTKTATINPNWPQVGGAFSAGVVTRGIDLPLTGQATYNGFFIGRYATSAALPAPGTYLVGADASATADFGTGLVSFSTINTKIISDSGSALTPTLMPGLNLSAMGMNIARTPTSNSFSGTANTTNGLTGQIAGAFYGPPSTTTAPFAPPEAGGAVQVSDSPTSPTQSMVGGFALKKQ